jgi:hypothetical protein
MYSPGLFSYPYFIILEKQLHQHGVSRHFKTDNEIHFHDLLLPGSAGVNHRAGTALSGTPNAFSSI